MLAVSHFKYHVFFLNISHHECWTFKIAPLLFCAVAFVWFGEAFFFLLILLNVHVKLTALNVFR